MILLGQLQLAGGRHASMAPAGDRPSSDSRRPTAAIDDGVLSLALPGFVGTEDEAREYAEISAEAVSTPGICGVVIDLRENDGGFIGPMIGGITSLLPEGPFETLVFPRDPAQPEIVRSIVDGNIVSNEEGVLWESIAGSALDPPPPVAVLISRNTASAGEHVALAFIGLEHVRSFGGRTRGLLSGPVERTIYNTVFALPVAEFGDRWGKIYGDKSIAPDEAAQDSETESEALAWLQSEGCPSVQ